MCVVRPMKGLYYPKCLDYFGGIFPINAYSENSLNEMHITINNSPLNILQIQDLFLSVLIVSIDLDNVRQVYPKINIKIPELLINMLFSQILDKTLIV